MSLHDPAVPAPVTSEHWDLPAVVAGLHAVRDRWREAQGRSQEFGGREFPSREALATLVEQLCGALFPMRLGPGLLRRLGQSMAADGRP